MQHRITSWAIGLTVLCLGATASATQAANEPTINPAEALPLCVTELWDKTDHLRVTDDADGRHLLVTDPAGRVLYDGRLDTEAQLGALPKRLMRKLNRLDNLTGIHLFKAHAEHGGVEVAIEPDDLPENIGNGAQLAVSSTTYMVDDGLLVVGDRRPVRQMREITVHKLTCIKQRRQERIEVTVPVERLIYMAVETW